MFDPLGQRWMVVQDCEADGGQHQLVDGDVLVPTEEDRLYFEMLWDDPMCSYPLRSGDFHSVVLSSDFFPTTRDFLSRPIRDVVDPDIRCLMQIALPSSPRLARRIVIGGYEDGLLDERARQIGALIRPHLEEIRVEAEARRTGVPRLTPREWEVLALRAAGLSHWQIAARLVVSVSTVDKHMENIRVRLGVHSANEAAAVALPHAPAAPGRRTRSARGASAGFVPAT